MRFLALQSSGKFELCFVIHFLNLHLIYHQHQQINFSTKKQ